MERFDILIPVEVRKGLDALSQRMGIAAETVVLFSLVRYIEVQHGRTSLSPMALLLKGGLLN